MRFLSIAVLAAGLAGCAWGKPALVVEMNGRRVEFEKFESGKIPIGLEVSHFDAGSVRVSGDKSLEVNGIPVQVIGNLVTIGGRRFTVDSDALIVVGSGGEIRVQFPVKVPSSQPAATPAPASK